MFQLKRGKKKPRTLHSENILLPGSATLPRALSWDEGCGGGGGEGVGVGRGWVRPPVNKHHKTHEQDRMTPCTPKCTLKNVK